MGVEGAWGGGGSGGGGGGGGAGAWAVGTGRLREHNQMCFCVEMINQPTSTGVLLGPLPSQYQTNILLILSLPPQQYCFSLPNNYINILQHICTHTPAHNKPSIAQLADKGYNRLSKIEHLSRQPILSPIVHVLEVAIL